MDGRVLLKRFPLHFRSLEFWMRHKQMPDQRLESFRVRRDSRGIDRGNYGAAIRHLARETAIAADDAADRRSGLLRVFQRTNQIRADVLFHIAATNREYEDHVIRFETTAS